MAKQVTWKVVAVKSNGLVESITLNEYRFANNIFEELRLAARNLENKIKTVDLYKDGVLEKSFNVVI